jgi:hypothetical protein
MLRAEAGTRPMADFSRVFTLEADDRPILAFEARATREAQSLCKESWLRSDLALLKSGGAPLLKPTAKLSVRPATAEEATIFAQGADAAKSSDDMVLVYLVELDGG